jgi:molecular chaperone GrpE
MVVTGSFGGLPGCKKSRRKPLKSTIRHPTGVAMRKAGVVPEQRGATLRARRPALCSLFDYPTTFSDMENTQENPTSQNPTPADEASQAGATAQPEAAAEAAAQAAQDDVGAALAEAQLKIAELQDQFRRAIAETDNVRKRGQEEVQKAHKFAIESFAEHLLPVMDSLEAAVTHGSDDLAKVREGVELTLRQLAGALEKGKVLAINPVGEKFDPHRHQAISMVPSEQDANTVVSVLQKGYVIADRVLRPALVTVSQPK